MLDTVWSHKRKLGSTIEVLEDFSQSTEMLLLAYDLTTLNSVEFYLYKISCLCSYNAYKTLIFVCDIAGCSCIMFHLLFMLRKNFFFKSISSQVPNTHLSPKMYA